MNKMLFIAVSLVLSGAGSRYLPEYSGMWWVCTAYLVIMFIALFSIIWEDGEISKSK